MKTNRRAFIGAAATLGLAATGRLVPPTPASELQAFSYTTAKVRISHQLLQDRPIVVVHPGYYTAKRLEAK